MLAKVYVKPELVNLIAVVHNGDLQHVMAMEVADVVRAPLLPAPHAAARAFCHYRCFAVGCNLSLPVCVCV
eukprot:COSAG03_NODE_22574_length_289_cov_1.042105_1_plen_70_part_01